jgi:hypothetical protein
VADAALVHGPDLISKIRERLQAYPEAEAEAAVTTEPLVERIRDDLLADLFPRRYRMTVLNGAAAFKMWYDAFHCVYGSAS